MADKAPAARACMGCDKAMQSLGTHQFRTGGPERGAFFFREWRELDESLLPLEVFVCMGCRRVDFGVPAGMDVRPA